MDSAASRSNGPVRIAGLLAALTGTAYMTIVLGSSEGPEPLSELGMLVR